MCVRRTKSARPDDRQLLAVTQQEVRMPPPRCLAERKQTREVADIAANFVVGFVLRLQSYLVHFANDALTDVEITAHHGRVWIRSTESAHSSFLEIHQDSTRSRQ